MNRLSVKADVQNRIRETEEGNNRAVSWISRSYDGPVDHSLPILFEDQNRAAVNAKAFQTWAPNALFLRLDVPTDRITNLLVMKDWLESRIPFFGSSEKFSVTTRGENEYLLFRLTNDTLLTFSSFNPTTPSFGDGSVGNVLLQDRRMQLELFVSNETSTGGSPSIKIDFVDESHDGQPVWLNAAWLASFGITEPVATHEDGTGLPVRRMGDFYLLNPAHFSAVTVAQPLAKGTPTQGVATGTGQEKHYSLIIPDSTFNEDGSRTQVIQASFTLGLETQSAQGEVVIVDPNFDLYVKRDSAASRTSHHYASTSSSSNEQIIVNNPAGGTWYLMVYAKSGSGTFTVTGDYLVELTPPSVNTNPYAPTPTSPATGATGVGLKPRMEWTSQGSDVDGDPVTYKVWMHANGGSEFLACQVNFPSKSCTVTNSLTRSTQYIWHVEASDNRGGSTDSTVSYFTTTTNRPPGACLTLNRDYMWVTAVSSCNDPDGDSFTVEFNWGDGTKTTIPNRNGLTNMPHKYGIAYCPSLTATVTLTVTDTFGASASQSAQTLVGDTRDQEPVSQTHATYGDGLPNCWEEWQGTSDFQRDSDFDGLGDLLESTYNSGANLARRQAAFCKGTYCEYPAPMVRDVYVEFDYMIRPAQYCATNPITGARNCLINEVSFKPSAGQIATAEHGLEQAGIIPHFDNGELGGGGQVPYLDDLRFRNGAGTNVVDFYDYKLGGNGVVANFDHGNRLGVYRYAIMGETYFGGETADGESSGVAEGSGDDLFVSMGVLVGEDDIAISGTIVHELGHNLCLVEVPQWAGSATRACEFEGIDNRDYRPADYVSSMNYRYQFFRAHYSDGTNGPEDHDDFTAIEVDAFISNAGAIDPAHGHVNGEDYSTSADLPVQWGVAAPVSMLANLPEASA